MPHRASPRGATAGFTLIELMIVVVVLAVLGALAYPSLLDSVRKGRRSDLYEGYAAVQQAQERYRSTHTAYAADLAALGLGARSAGGHYDFELTDVSATGYRFAARARADGAQSGDRQCQRFEVVLHRASTTRSAKDAGGADSTHRCWPQ